MIEAGLISIGALSMLLIVACLLLWKTRGFRISLDGVRLVDSDSSAVDELRTLRNEYVERVNERDRAVQAMDQLAEGLKRRSNAES